VKELLRTTEPVFLTWVVAVLAAEGIAAVVLDVHASVLQGSTMRSRGGSWSRTGTMLGHGVS
jgi:hypothetical protein